ncbi:hypothetical protein GUITHDRAFT_133965 [Guillardia theta CCMP2712]|uniref:Uncharacterized protein n=1 Tax=Guillardia theta (strain CCMP2712) TaxID=905079 RepID=L1JVN5_GUITC|nr:hypothetical protein GUITHDRAFT_133965 [Guillardia theta CCMP2712]EKX52260.1 hypothetical protein GUITHDRAFT_133965 [Guillardia theta CCMP2712]|eukprot:XP_005839240.1 hypothetical protein GUITHDRAFT_133965 [Guillardia theta CCMP2712]
MVDVAALGINENAAMELGLFDEGELDKHKNKFKYYDPESPIKRIAAVGVQETIPSDLDSRLKKEVIESRKDMDEQMQKYTAFRNNLQKALDDTKKANQEATVAEKSADEAQDALKQLESQVAFYKKVLPDNASIATFETQVKDAKTKAEQAVRAASASAENAFKLEEISNLQSKMLSSHAALCARKRAQWIVNCYKAAIRGDAQYLEEANKVHTSVIDQYEACIQKAPTEVPAQLQFPVNVGTVQYPVFNQIVTPQYIQGYELPTNFVAGQPYFENIVTSTASTEPKYVC